MKKRVRSKLWVTTGIAGLLILMLVAGCSNNNEKKAEAPPAQLEDAGGKAEPKPQVEEKRGEITVAIYYNGSIPAEEGDAEVNRWTEWINENGPVDVKFVPIARRESLQILNTLFAAGSAPDLIVEFDNAYRDSLYTQKQLMPLDDVIAEHSTVYKEILNGSPLMQKLGKKPDGKTYELGRIQPMLVNHVMYIRTDWLKNLGLDVPKTTEEFYKVAKAFAEDDPDQNNKKDTFGTSLAFMSGENIREMFGNVGWVVKDGQLVRDWERFEAHAAFMKQLYDDGIVDKDYLADTNGAKTEQDFVNGKLGIFGVQNGIDSTGYKVFNTFKKNNPDATVVPIALPASSFGQFSPYLEPSARMVAGINAKAKDPASVMKYIDFMNELSTINTIKYGMEGVHSETDSKGCRKIIDEDKYKKEVSWTTYFRNVMSSGLEGECAQFAYTLDDSDPLDKEFKSFIPIAEEAYLSPKRPIPGFTSEFFYPSVPQEIAEMESTLSASINEIVNKAVVGGKKNSIDKAIQDAKSNWEKAGGKDVEEWYKNWYAENKDTALLTKDLYE